MIAAALVTFALVFLRAVQQLNVVHDRWIWASVTPFALAAAEVGLILVVVDKGWPAVPWVGMGGSAGVLSAMALHRWAREIW